MMNSDDVPHKLLWSIRETADFLGISESALRRWIAHTPSIPTVQVSPRRTMIPRHRLLAWLGVMGLEVPAGDHRTLAVVPPKGEHFR